MSVLILSNSAPNYHFFFNSIAEQFIKEGDNVVFAVDSEHSKLNNRVKDISDSVYVFSKYFQEYKINDNILLKYSDCNLNYALLSDFERASTYGIWNKSQYKNDYFEKLKSALLDFFENIFEQEKIELVIYENVSNTFAYFAYLVAKKSNVNYQGFSGSRLPNRFEISEGPFDFERIKENFDRIVSGDLLVPDAVMDEVDKYIENIDVIEPDYMKLNNLSEVSIAKKYINIEKILHLASLFKYGLKINQGDFQIGNPLKTHLKLFWRNLIRSLKCKFLIKFLYEIPAKKDVFFLYPLHFHPESSTSVLAGNNLEEYEVIKTLAFNLPQGTKLYVKDHKSAWGFPSLNFYKKIKRLPNVVLLSPNEPTKKLIKKSKGIATLTSTVGYEALLLKKKVLLFGRVFYEFHKNVYRMKSRDDIHKLLLSFLNDESNETEIYNKRFVQAYWLSTFPKKINLTSKHPLNASDANIYKAALRRVK